MDNRYNEDKSSWHFLKSALDRNDFPLAGRQGACKLYVSDLWDAAFLDQVFSENDIDGVINFTAYSLVGESVTDLLKYYGNHEAGSQSVLTAMKEHGIHKIVFPSPDGAGKAAELYCPRTGIALEMTTTLEGMQLYTAGWLTERPGKGGALYGPGHAVCLETQHFPDAVNQPAFPSPVLRAAKGSWKKYCGHR